MLFEVVIPTYNNREKAQQCLAALALQSETDLFRVWLCIDGSTDGTFQWLETLPPDSYPFAFQWLQHQGRINRGRSATRNLPLAQLQAPYTLFLDSDIEPEPNWLWAWKQWVLAHPQAAGAGAVFYRNWRTHLWGHYQQTRGGARFAHGQPMPAYYLNTQNAVVPTALLQQLGGFDEHFQGWGAEDSELGYRLGLAGVPLVRNAQAVGWAVADKSMAVGLAQLRAFGASNLLYMQRKHRNWHTMYHVGWLKPGQGGWRGWLLRRAVHPAWGRLAKCLLGIPWRGLQLRALHLLVVQAVVQGLKAGPLKQAPPPTGGA
jgi:glycosyltransferase involved in cell wall biosynthesis